MTALNLRGHDPRLHSVKDHVINDNSVPQVDTLLDAGDSKNLELLLG